MILNNKNLKHDIEEEYLKVIRVIDSVTSSQYFIIGALARDIHVYNIHGLNLSERVTGDVDLAVSVENWERFKEVKASLLKDYGYKSDPKNQPQKVISPNGIEVDILPFGVIATNNKIQWPDSGTMSVVGFNDAFKNLWEINYPDFTLKIVSIEIFTVLKLVAWNDRKN